MNFHELPTVTVELTTAFSKHLPLTACAAGEYEKMHWPRFPAIMHFSVHRYAAAGFGDLFTMDTRAMGGLMQLATLVWTPNAGTDVPLLLIDVMAMGKKRAAFVEYYDCTEQATPQPALQAVAGRYALLPDYAETPAWYVQERAPYSLIKGGTDDKALLAMLSASADAYGQACVAHAEPRAENRARLSRFIDRMATEGNPSSATLEKVLGKAGADRFFRTLVMPASNHDTEPTISKS